MTPIPPNELIIDLFAGGGGASIGLERACGRVDLAVNHDPIAVAMHQVNHPRTRHLVQNVNAVDPREVCQGRPVGLLWCSPDCTHHSKASGRRPRSKRLRDLPKVMVQWAQLVRPRLICMENVEEIVDWGPLLVLHPAGKCTACPECEGRFPLEREDLPCPKCKGMYWNQLVGQLIAIGYEVQFRELRACDYGAPTLRKRLFMVARCDGRPIEWPAPTHGAGLIPWRVAAECIDWTVPVTSIFGRKKPLAEATMRRIARGFKRYVLEAANPFILRFNQNGIGQGIDEPLDTVMAGATRFGLVAPSLICNTTGHAGGAVTEPLHTVTTGGHHGLVAPYYIPHHGERPGQEPRCMSAERPMVTLTPQNNPALVAAWMIQHNLGATGHAMTEPVSTLVGTGSQQQLCTSHLAVLRNNMDGASVEEPLHTVLTNNHFMEIRAFFSTYYGCDQDTRMDEPLPTITTRDRFGLVVVHQLADIGMRMLIPRELFNAMDFPRDYVIDPVTEYVDKRGRRTLQPITKTDQVRCCGNAVCPPVAYAIAAANYVPDEASLKSFPTRARRALGNSRQAVLFG